MQNVQVISLLGSHQSIFGKSLLHGTCMWMDKCDNANERGDCVLVFERT